MGRMKGASVTDDSWLSVWAKTVRDEENRVTHWLPLHQHLADSAGVAGLLVDEWVSLQVRSRIGQDFPRGATDVRNAAVWLAAVPDVGKASPAFAVQVPVLAGRMRDFGLVARPELAQDGDRRAVSHGLVGYWAIRGWLTAQCDFVSRKGAAQWAAIVGSHHGRTPEDSQLDMVRRRGELTGTGLWEAARVRHLERATDLIGGLDVLRSFRSVVLSKPSQVLLTAIVIVADWIASNTDLFPLYPISEASRPPVLPDAASTDRRVKEAWRQLALLPRWTAMPLGADLDEIFSARFGKPGVAARPVQHAAVQMAHAQPRAGLVIVEAPMGAGKTEAALLAAEVLAHRSQADGCFVALPTQATSDAMFGRVLRWLTALPADSALSVNLVHGKASLNDDYAGVVRESRYADIGDNEPDAVVVHQWMRGRKRAVLASFVVGTIDQILFAGLKSRHLMLRHLALAGKVVIIDEVHAYDVYMSRYLDRVLHWLGAYGVPVVLLSATLPPARRTELLTAYESGTGQEPAPVEQRVRYPVVSATGMRSPAELPLPEQRTTVAVDRLDDELDTLVGFLRRHLAHGGCAVVVRNTVTRVQETAERLREVFGDQHVTVNHSRFLSCDRARTDRALLRRFGPPDPDSSRPDLHIVVASQVVEQSLDVDFDMMVTDLAPIDLVLQRLGRVHRHERGRPAGVRQARCALVGVEDWASTPVRAVRGSRRVYGEHPLLRSAALLADRESITLPEDIAPLVASAYGDDPLGPEDWQPTMMAARHAAAERAEQRRARAAEFLLGETVPATTLVGWLYAGVGDADGIDDSHRGLAQVRDGEESLEVLVVQRDESGGLLTPTWIERGAGQQIPTDVPVSQSQARVIASCTLRLPLAMSHPGVIDGVIAALERNTFTGFDQVPLLKGQLVLVLDSDRQAVVSHGDTCFRLFYDLSRGLLHERG